MITVFSTKILCLFSQLCSSIADFSVPPFFVCLMCSCTLVITCLAIRSRTHHHNCMGPCRRQEKAILSFADVNIWPTFLIGLNIGCTLRFSNIRLILSSVARNRVNFLLQLTSMQNRLQFLQAMYQWFCATVL